MSGSRLPRTYDLRLWVTVDGPALELFLADVRELAVSHPGVEPFWITERTDRHGRPRIRIHPPPSNLGQPEGGTRWPKV